jgi:Lrp/AsnC family leucine-responsive transcriptional regulator
VQRREEVGCYSMSGEWACLIRVVVRNVKDYEQFLTYKAVANSSPHFVLKSVKYTTELPL